ncbi:MAG: hypothetical protein CV087_11085, partial [Candidatus Brocadia sp. WS118]
TIAPPEPDEPEPVVIVPGMLVSISPLTTFLDQPSNYWTFTLGARGVYSSLIKQFELAGMFEDEDVFVAHYDWRKPVNSNVDTYLKPVIDKAKEVSGSDKVDIVAHSMGGLLARSYIQGDNYENDVDQLITLGTPHEGAADAYVAWEGGDFPATWSEAIKFYVRNIARSLNIAKDVNLDPPISFRIFFPSLKDLLPISQYITREEVDIEPNFLTEQNQFLQSLEQDISNMESRGINVTSIVGTNVNTLDRILLTNSRTVEDQVLERWRDGHPFSEPIVPDSSAGDQRVLLDSASLGNNIISIPSANHDDLPHIAREEVLENLGIQPEAFSYEPPDIDSLLGLVVLSPVEPEIACGEDILSKNQNTFENAEYIFDSSNTDSPKVLTIGNPPEGECSIKLKGTGSGKYHVITTYSDNDETISTVREGTAELEKAEQYKVTILPDSFTPPVDDIVGLICQLPDSIRHLMLDEQLEPEAYKLHGIVTRTCSYAKNWQKENNEKKPKRGKINQWLSKTQNEYKRYSQELNNQIEHGNLSERAMKILIEFRTRLQDAGWV